MQRGYLDSGHQALSFNLFTSHLRCSSVITRFTSSWLPAKFTPVCTCTSPASDLNSTKSPSIPRTPSYLILRRPLASQPASLLFLLSSPDLSLLLNTAHSISRATSAQLLQVLIGQVSGRRAMDVLLELDDLRVKSLVFGLQGRVAGGGGEAVGAAAGFGGVVTVVLELRDTLAAPEIVVSA